MKQLTHKLKDGSLKVLEVPPPVLGPGMVLVKNHFSLISAGTEGSTVKAAQKSLAGKAKERPQQVKQALDVLRQQGPVQAYRAVMKKLDSYSPLGYSSSGEVINAAPDVKGFSPGDLVACGGGGYASHAEIIAVPANLCVRIPKDADTKIAAYNTLGAIALQGVRQADLGIGETCAVIGLGLIGQLTCLILRAGGIRVIGMDIEKSAADIASKHCSDLAFATTDEGITGKIEEFTDGIGVDAAIIAASTQSTDPINLAGSILRRKGRVVIVGDVPTGFDREPHFYKKELELRMSCSYGPGRYDTGYEEKGIDYPVGYVRWTENRNMRAFQGLLHSGKIDIDYLTTHVFPLDNASRAYELILKKEEQVLGILIQYDVSYASADGKVVTGRKAPSDKVNIAFVGAGSYATGHLLPNIPKGAGVMLKGVMARSGSSSRYSAEKFGFEFCTSDEKDIFGNDEINTVFIATRHNTHAEYVKKALLAGKNVFVEKPLCLSARELEEIAVLFNQRCESEGGPLLMVGFNRRFSPLIELLKSRLGSGPMAMMYRINAGHVPPENWAQDKDTGGGRIIGEVCHFVDLLTHINGSLPEQVFAAALKGHSDAEDTLTVNLSFENGSIGAISYFSNGSRALPKEYLEVYRAGATALIRDFRELQEFGSGKPFNKKLLTQDKGQKKMVMKTINAVKNGGSSPIPFDEIYSSTLATFGIADSLRTNTAVRIRQA
jgi:predicted dehydrogenase/threonine dehydrogenase-like Zn-dependent dehydrogenase